MNGMFDVQLVTRSAPEQRGVYSKGDLQVLLAERHPAAFQRRAQALEAAGFLRRFCRGMYVSDPFDLPTLSQQLGPESYVSFGTALARHLLIGPRPDRQLLAAKPGHSRTYRGLGVEVVHLQIARHLDFGHTVIDGVRWADAEKAVLDTLYFHLRGRRAPFDVHSDIDFAALDRGRIACYLERYRNPKFVAFARGVLDLT
jgi:predicted transcriptional regulator of viral defense system